MKRHGSSVIARPRKRLHRMGLLGAVVLAVMAVACVASLPWTLARDQATLSPRRYEANNLDLALLPPSWARHQADERERLGGVENPPWALLGTDRLGRDVLARCLLGGCISLAVGLAAAGIAVIIGTLYGSLAGSLGGRVDAVLMRTVDVLYGLPYILLVVLLAVASDGLLDRAAAARHADPANSSAILAFLADHPALVNIVTLLVAIGGISWLTMARVIRGQVLSLKEQPFMEACRALGIPFRRQFFFHLLPNLLGPITVYATLTVPAAILSESFLSFLGIGIRDPLPSWGNLAAEGLSELNTVRIRWWLLLFPCLFIALTLLALNFLGEGLRARLDPRSRG